MKHNLKITLILVTMFVITQLIGLFVISVYSNNSLPYGMEPPKEVVQETSIFHLLFAFIIAITLFYILTKVNAEKFIKAWFFVVTVLALGLTINAFLLFRGSLFSLDSCNPSTLYIASIIALIIAVPLAYIKIFRRDMYIHNLTELLIYPGIAAVFLPVLNVLLMIILLLLISLYDIWAVWHSGFMQKIANYQISQLKIFTGFFIPYTGKKEKEKIKEISIKYRNKSEKFIEEKLRKSRIKVQLAILGGGDVVFPIMASGVFYKYFGIESALIVSGFSILALISLFILARKGKFYPAMPFLTIGLYIGMIVSWIFI